MPTIRLETRIHCSPEVAFDLSRSIDLHQVSAAQTQEKAIGGRTSGLIELGETVTWRARHFGIMQTLTARITAFDRPVMFVDEMVSGAFRSFRHEHHFRSEGDWTVMTDVFFYRSPLGLLGKLADGLFLKAYMTRFLTERNRVIRAYAESGKWEEVL